MCAFISESTEATATWARAYSSGSGRYVRAEFLWIPWGMEKSSHGGLPPSIRHATLVECHQGGVFHRLLLCTQKRPHLGLPHTEAGSNRSGL